MIYVTGDCHGNFRRFQSDCFPEQANMTKDDTVIITGDCGGVWFGDSRDDETLDWLERLPSRLPSSAVTTKTMTHWKDTPWTSGTEAGYTAFALMCCI